VTSVRIFPNLEALSRSAAQEFVRLARERTRRGRRFSAALAGGSTPRRMYELLAGAVYRERVPWKSVHLFWTDERCVLPDHPQSNFRMAQKALLSKISIPAGNIHRIPVECGTPKAAAATYEEEIQNFFRLRKNAWPTFDLMLLGLGEDGHTASLFPRSAALRETKRLAVAALGRKPNLPRVTLTLPVLNHARHLIWLVTGAAKRPVLHAVLGGRGASSEKLPAQKVRPMHGTAVWFVDQAISSLNSEPSQRIRILSGCPSLGRTDPQASAIRSI